MVLFHLAAKHSLQEALDRFEVARQYKQHLDAVASDRHLEKFFEDCQQSVAFHGPPETKI